MITMVRERQRDERGRTGSPDGGCSLLCGRSSSICSKSHFRAVLTVCVILVGTAFVIAVVVISSYFHSRNAVELSLSQDLKKSFCCPDHLTLMAQYVNINANPCSSFFQYVCSNVIRHGLWKGERLNFELERFMVTGVVPEKFQPVGRVGRFLMALHKSCLKTMFGDDSFVSHVAFTLTQRMRHLLGNVSSATSFMYFLTTALCYQFPSVLDISFSPFESVMTLYVEGVCELKDFLVDSLNAALESTRQILRTAVTVKSVLTFMKKLCSRFPNTTEGAMYAFSNDRDIIDKHVWSVEDIEAGLSYLALKVDNEVTIRVLGVRQIRAIHDILGVEKDKGSIAAYFLWHSVTNAMRQLKSQPVSYQKAFELCRNTAVALENLWNRFMAEALATPEKDEQVAATFSAVRRAIFQDSLSSWIFDTGDVDILRHYFSNLTVLTPSVFLQTSIALPTSTEDFLDNLVRAREYSFRVSRMRYNRSWPRDILLYGSFVIHDQTQYIITPEIYDSVYVRPTYSTLLNMAVLGQLLAEALWYVTLFRTAWSPATMANIKRMQTCFADAYLGDIHPRYRDETISHALGMQSVLRAFERPDWHDTKIAWSMWKMSHAQFFHILATYSTCRRGFQPENVRYTDGALKYVKDFVDAFRCGSDTGMAASGRCGINRKNAAGLNVV
ncbi:hypothetical protein HPB49_020512 [Dermacentor silvarum]|uniref:Uncharacterized protein n=1 Tax=Dermacentor silvarum TaxID=543639 RepID=A0ACB8CM93_DERSI|nr:hypothetical protein HPB49_020512 [Dermacentor silvarum]